MSLCKHCGGLSHPGICGRIFRWNKPAQASQPSPQPPTRIEWCGRLQVHVPIKPRKTTP